MNDSGTWTIGQLAERAAVALGAGQAAPRSGRIRDVPNERLIRWYVTIGLMDPPLGRRGRIALYGPRHLLQLVAVKRRQAEGRSLADIQAELTGATDATLRTIARLPEPDAGTAARPAGDAGTVARPGGDSGTGEPAPPRNRERFWAARPAIPAPAPAPAPAAAPAPAPAPVPAAAPDLDADEGAAHAGDIGDIGDVGGLVYGIRLAPGVRLLLDASPATAAGPPGAADLAALRAAARPLLEALARGGHAARTPDHDSSDPGHGRGPSSAEGKGP